MAWIGFYMRRYLAYIPAKSGVMSDGATPAHVEKSGANDAALSCCIASRVRRSTSATGE